jgi:O-antigen/teichoic acid export membrane protein
VSEDNHRERSSANPPAEAIRRLVGRGSVYTLGLALQMLTAFLVVPVITRLLTPAAYGRAAAGLVVFTLLSIVSGAGLPDAATRVFFAGPDGPRDARRLMLALAAIAVVLSLILDLTGPLWAPLFGFSYGAVLQLAVWGGAVGAVNFGAQMVLRAQERAWTFLGVSMLGTVGGQAVGLALTAALHSATGYIAGVVAGAAVAAIAGLVRISAFRAGLPRLREVRTSLALGLPIVPHGLAIYVLASADRIVIAAILGLAATGRYQVAYAVGGLGVALVTAVNQAWLPVVLGAPANSRWEVLTATSRVVNLIAAVIAGALALVAPLGLLIAAPPAYGRAALVPVAAIVAFSAVPYATSGTYFQIVFARGRTGVMAIAAPVAAAINIALNVLLLRPIGLTGAAIATAAAYAALPAIVWLRARRLVSLPRADRDALGAWLMAAPFVAAGALLPSDALGALARCLLGIVELAVAYRLIRAAIEGSSTVPSALSEPGLETSAPIRPTVQARP